jgi:hypothetical protein
VLSQKSKVESKKARKYCFTQRGKVAKGAMLSQKLKVESKKHAIYFSRKETRKLSPLFRFHQPATFLTANNS